MLVIYQKISLPAIGLNYLLTVRTNNTNTQMLGLEQQDETRKGGRQNTFKCKNRSISVVDFLILKRNQVQQSGLTKVIFFCSKSDSFRRAFNEVFFSCNIQPSQFMITTIVRGNFRKFTEIFTLSVTHLKCH